MSYTVFNKLKCLLVFVLLSLTLPIYADEYEDAWIAIGKNDRKKAKELLLKAANNPKRTADAYMTLLYLDSFDRKEDAEGYIDKLFDKVNDPYPYIYAQWFNDGVLGDYYGKSKEQLKLANKILSDSRANGSVKAAVHYGLGTNWQYMNKFNDAAKEWNQIGSINKWQLVGPFDNISGSGFDKNYAPIEQPTSSNGFTSANNANVNWFSPGVINNDAWIFTEYFIRDANSVVFAQSFVDSQQDIDAVLCAGFAGNIKIWVNDKLILSEAEELRTELDMIKATCQLKKGTNRVLLQLGYTNSTDEPNFIVRFTDKNFNVLSGLTYSDVFKPYPKDKGNYNPQGSIKLFAEEFFETKIKSEPQNIVNYLLLCDTYLRSKKVFEAQKVLNQALKIAPDNLLLKYESILVLQKAGNRTDLLQVIQQIKEQYPDCLFSLAVATQELIEEEKYEDAAKLVEKRISLFGESEETYRLKISIAASKNETQEILKLMQTAYSKYPDSYLFVKLQASIAKDVYKEPKNALKILEEYVKTHFSIQAMEHLASEYFEQGMNEKGLKILEKIYEAYPAQPSFLTKLENYYYGIKNNDKALMYAQKALAQTPYSSSYWQDLGVIYEQKGDKAEAIKAYKKGLHYNPNSYSTRRKLQLLESQTDLLKSLPNTVPYDLLKKTKTADAEGKYDWYYVLDEKGTIVYPEGTSETYYNIAVKIVTDKGIDYWKESNIPYNEYSERMVIEKAEVVKKNGSKISAERNDNAMVFTGLEKGDGIYIRYKVESYSRGRLAKEFWDKYSFRTFVPVETTRYSLLVANNIAFDYKFLNSDIKPVIQPLGDYKLYTWETGYEDGFKEENLMPPAGDIGKTLHISTIKTWQEIANWYSDVSSTQAKAGFEVKEVYQTLFSEGKSYTQLEKARIIYDYIVRNIRYSSVPFRQSAYVPQKASVTLNTKLGDCKDLSTLYATLAREAGLKANLVLIDTRDNGYLDLLYPSPEFNHCIVKVIADNKPYYLELTDPNLPFASLPAADVEALSLEIPFNNDMNNITLKPLKAENKTSDEIKRITNIKIDKNAFVVDVVTTRKGNLTSSTREHYTDLNKEKQIEKIKKSISSDFKNPVTVSDVNYSNLETLTDSIKYNYSFTVKNEIIEIGDLKTFKIPFADTFVRIDNFPEDERQYPISYWRYEDTDMYSETMTITLAGNQQFTEIPKSVNAKFNGTQYSLVFTKVSPNQLKIERKVTISKNDIPAKDYQLFKEFINTVSSAESKYIAFK